MMVLKNVTRVLSFHRNRMLRKHWKQLRRALKKFQEPTPRLLAALVYGESQRAAKHPLPQFYGASKVELYAPWGDTVEKAFEKSQSAELQEQLRGIATWLVVVTLETQQAKHLKLKALHREVLPMMEHFRELHRRVLAIQAAS
jgi:hypothetical protein